MSLVTATYAEKIRELKYLRMPAGVFVSDLAQLAESDDDFQAAFAIAPEFLDVAVEAETVAVFDREFGAAKFESAAAFASETVAVVVLARVRNPTS